MYICSTKYVQWRCEGVCRPGANVFVAAASSAIRSPIIILMVTTMATINSTISWGVNFQNFIFLPLQMLLPAQCRPGRMPPSRRH